METTVKTAPLPIVVKKPSLAAILHELDKAESTTDKSKRAAVCYICKQNHHFSIHSTLEQYMKEYVQGLKQNMEEFARIRFDAPWAKWLPGKVRTIPIFLSLIGANAFKGADDSLVNSLALLAFPLEADKTK